MSTQSEPHPGGRSDGSGGAATLSALVTMLVSALTSESPMARLDGAAPIGDVQLATDPEMIYSTGELTLWEP